MNCSGGRTRQGFFAALTASANRVSIRTGRQRRLFVSCRRVIPMGPRVRQHEGHEGSGEAVYSKASSALHAELGQVLRISLHRPAAEDARQGLTQ